MAAPSTITRLNANDIGATRHRTPELIQRPRGRRRSNDRAEHKQRLRVGQRIDYHLGTPDNHAGHDSRDR